LALFNLAIDSKLRGCDLVALRVDDVAPNGYAIDRANFSQRKSGRPARFEPTADTAAYRRWDQANVMPKCSDLAGDVVRATAGHQDDTAAGAVASRRSTMAPRPSRPTRCKVFLPMSKPRWRLDLMDSDGCALRPLGSSPEARLDPRMPPETTQHALAQPIKHHGCWLEKVRPEVVSAGNIAQLH
jgi:hypothetical protein